MAEQHDEAAGGVQVIGAGFGRTGTLSLKFALEKLGFGPCYHMMEVGQRFEDTAVWKRAHDGEPVDWQSFLAGWRATVDWPSCNFWREQLAAFPGAKVILSKRDPARWYTSVMNTIYPSSQAAMHGEDERGRAFGSWANEIIWEGVFDGRMDDEAHVLDVLANHEADVRSSVPAERLLEYTPGDGWAPLCDFLGVAVPDEDYPRTNSTEEFRVARGLSDEG